MGTKKLRSARKKLHRQRNIQRVEYGSSRWADEQLRYIIGVLRGKLIKCTWRGRLNLALIVKERLQGMGFKWHSARVENWIHRIQRDHKLELEQNPKDSDSSEGGEGSNYVEFLEGCFCQ
jgi:hypothetical protein